MKICAVAPNTHVVNVGERRKAQREPKAPKREHTKYCMPKKRNQKICCECRLRVIRRIFLRISYDLGAPAPFSFRFYGLQIECLNLVLFLIKYNTPTDDCELNKEDFYTQKKIPIDRRLELELEMRLKALSLCTLKNETSLQSHSSIVLQNLLFLINFEFLHYQNQKQKHAIKPNIRPNIYQTKPFRFLQIHSQQPSISTQIKHQTSNRHDLRNRLLSETNIHSERHRDNVEIKS